MFEAMENGLRSAARILALGLPADRPQARQRIKEASGELAKANAWVSKSEIMLAAHKAEHDLVTHDKFEYEVLGAEPGKAWAVLGYGPHNEGASIKRSRGGPNSDPEALNKSAAAVAAAQAQVAAARLKARDARIALLYREEQLDKLLADVEPDGRWIAPRARWTSSGRVRGTPLAGRYKHALRTLQDREGLYRAATGSGLASAEGQGHNAALLFFITYEVVDAWDRLDAVMEEIIAAEMGWEGEAREVSDWAWPRKEAGRRGAAAGAGDEDKDEDEPDAEPGIEGDVDPALDGDPSPAAPQPLPRNYADVQRVTSSTLPSRLGAALGASLRALYAAAPDDIDLDLALRTSSPGRARTPVRYLYGAAWERFVAAEGALGAGVGSGGEYGALGHAERLARALGTLGARGLVDAAAAAAARRLAALARSRYERYASVQVLLDREAECTEGKGDPEEDKDAPPFIFPMGTSRD
ncbi:hypothetical protein Q8F55_008932 [Vanrija albida]|uniref:Uncharacterized protein n=1 Tax=Vanrija albida TaxID=181172 RepID=A0ABR3PSF5_9TREE